MTFTYDLNTHGCLILRADSQEQERLRAIIAEHGTTYTAEYEALEPLICNSELTWIEPEEIGALTSAPILGLRNEQGEPSAAWGFMDYQVRSFVEDLIETGEAVFIS